MIVMRERYLQLPKSRVGVAIGPEGAVKRRIERETGTKLIFDSDTGKVVIRAGEENPLGPLVAEETLKAIGRGFSPDRAFRLFGDDVYLEVIDITSYAGRSDKARTRLKGRVIGEAGKTRKIIEETTGAAVSVYGKTVSLIGTPKQLEVAREAVHMLLGGAPHSVVYSFLERKRRELKRELKIWRARG